MLGNKREGDNNNTGSVKRQCSGNETKLTLATALHAVLLAKLPRDAEGKFWLKCGKHRAQFATPTVEDLMQLSKEDLKRDLESMPK